MHLTSKLVLVIGLTLTLVIQSINTNDFCDSYANNGFEIDYGFTAWVWDIDWRHILVIGLDYWELKIDSNKVKFMSVQSTRLDGLDNQYRAVFAFQTPYHTYETGFLTKNNNQIVWKIIDKNMFNIYPSKHLPTDMPFGDDFNPSLAFQIRSDNKYVVCFVDKRLSIDNNTEYYVYSYRLFDFQDIDIGTHFRPISLQLANDSTQMLEQISNEYKLIAAFTPLEDLEYLYLYKVNKTIGYCFTNSYTHYQRCNKEYIKVLTDCSDAVIWSTVSTTEVITESNTESETVVSQQSTEAPIDIRTEEPNKFDDNDSNPLVIVTIVVILLLFFICLLIYLFIRKKNSKTIGKTARIGSVETISSDEQSNGSENSGAFGVENKWKSKRSPKSLNTGIDSTVGSTENVAKSESFLVKSSTLTPNKSSNYIRSEIS